MRENVSGLKKFNWRLWFSLCLLALIPALYQTIKTSLIATVGKEDVFNIIGQMEWYDLINETLQAFLIVPLYSILNKILNHQKEEFAKNVFKTGTVSFAIYALFSIGVFVYASVLIQTMNVADVDMVIVSKYLRMETAAFIIGIIVSFVNVVFVVLEQDKNVYIFLSIRTVLAVISDYLLIPKFGVYGVGAANIIVNIVLAAIGMFLLYKQNRIQVCLLKRSDFQLFREWFKVGVFSGTQQFIDNFIYAVMICRMVNMVAEQGNYWVANNFIWGWLLIPITALTEVVRSDCKYGYKKLKQFNYYFVVGATIVLWVISIPAWLPFYKFVEQVPRAQDIFMITIKLAPFYIAYAGSAIIDNIFIGLGKTIYNMINSLIINLVYYGVFYLLHLAKVITFSMNTIIFMFGFGMIVHWIVSIVEEKFFVKRNI